jgi:hypothetical protein
MPLAKGLFVVKEVLGYQRNWRGCLQKMVNAFNICHSVSGDKQGNRNCSGENTVILGFVRTGLKRT